MLALKKCRIALAKLSTNLTNIFIVFLFSASLIIFVFIILYDPFSNKSFGYTICLFIPPAIAIVGIFISLLKISKKKLTSNKLSIIKIDLPYL